MRSRWRTPSRCSSTNCPSFHARRSKPCASRWKRATSPYLGRRGIRSFRLASSSWPRRTPPLRAPRQPLAGLPLLAWGSGTPSGAPERLVAKPHRPKGGSAGLAAGRAVGSAGRRMQRDRGRARAPRPGHAPSTGREARTPRSKGRRSKRVARCRRRPPTSCKVQRTRSAGRRAASIGKMSNWQVRGELRLSWTPTDLIPARPTLFPRTMPHWGS